MAIIEFSHVTKEYPMVVGKGKRSLPLVRPKPEMKRAVDDISFSVQEGEIFGLLGPNGAGKTTTIKMLCTLLLPSSGSIHVAGVDVTRDPVSTRSRIGAVLSSERSLYWRLTARENLEFFGGLFGMYGRQLQLRIDELLGIVEMTDRQNDLVSRLSTGMRRRLTIAKALLHDPPILLLDEPTNGLDPHSARSIREMLLKLNSEQNKTILITTHYMEEADYLCHRVCIIDEGRIVALGSPSQLKEIYSTEQSLVLVLRHPEGKAATAVIESIPGVRKATHIGVRGDGSSEVRVTLQSGVRVDEVMREAFLHGFDILTVHLIPPSLEDAFLTITGKVIRE